MSTGFCYAIMFTSGVTKFGMTSDIAGRIKSHKHAALAHNSYVSKVIFSVEHRNYKQSEDAVLAMAKNSGKKQTGNEYFSGMSVREVSEIMSAVCGKVIECEDVTKGGTAGQVLLLISPYVISNRSKRGKKSSSTVSDRILSILNHNTGTTLAVLHNKTKIMKSEIAVALLKLEGESMVSKIKCAHIVNKKEVIKWTLA